MNQKLKHIIGYVKAYPEIYNLKSINNDSVEVKTKRLTRSNELVNEYNHFDNGYKTWNGLGCPFCGDVFDPDSVKDEEYYPNGVNNPEVEILEWYCPTCANGWAKITFRTVLDVRSDILRQTTQLSDADIKTLVGGE